MNIINPITDHEQWPSLPCHDQTQPILPPPFKKQTGRPRKVRKKGQDEVNVEGKVTRRGTEQSYSNCGDTTHNKMKCKKPPPDQPRNKQRTKRNNVKFIVFLQLLFYHLHKLLV